MERVLSLPKPIVQTLVTLTSRGSCLLLTGPLSPTPEASTPQHTCIFSTLLRRWPGCSLALLIAFGLQKLRPIQDLHNSPRQQRICHEAVGD